MSTTGDDVVGLARRPVGLVVTRRAGDVSFAPVTRKYYYYYLLLRQSARRGGDDVPSPIVSSAPFIGDDVIYIETV